MNVVVLLRAVPDREALTQDPPLVLDAPSLVAIGLALGLRTTVPGVRLHGICAGPAEWEAAIRDGLALDLDSVVRVDGHAETDVVTTAKAIAGQVSADTVLVVAGSAASDHGSGLLPAAIAEVLGWAHIGAVTAIERHDGALAVRVRGDAGARRLLRLPQPCVLQAASAPAPSLYPKLAKKIAARKAAIPVVAQAHIEPRLRFDGYGPARPVTRTLFKPSTTARPAERMRQLMSGGMAKRGGQTLAAEAGVASQLADVIEAQGFFERPGNRS